MATRTHSTTAPSSQCAYSLAADAAVREASASTGCLADAATAAVLAHLPIPFVHRPCAPVADHRTSGELLDAIDREIARQAAALTCGGTHAPA